MKFLLKWLGLSVEKTPGISVRPTRTFPVALGLAACFGRCVEGLEDVLGAQVRELDEQRGIVEASFGLMFSERIACSMRPIDETNTEVSLESRRIAASSLPKDSAVLDRLELWMREGR
ncbi:MAG: hypothetical protein NVS9B12_06920 [Vulcanimicrobiaceae bacterium]